MLNRIPLLLIALGLIVNGTGVGAASNSGQFAVKGIGHHKCSDYLAARAAKSSAYSNYGHYIAGYLTAGNRLLSDTVDLTSWETIDVVSAYVANLCRIRGDVFFAQALEGVAAMMMPNRLRGNAELVEVSAGGKSIKVYASVIARLKKALIEGNYFNGSIDSRFDQATIRALKDFQKSRDIPQTGLPDQQSLYLLLGQNAFKNN